MPSIPVVVSLVGWLLGQLPIPDQYQGEELPPYSSWTREKAELGRRLLGDPVLSRDRFISCKSCHDPLYAFADTRRFSQGVGGARGSRNSPTLINRALGREQFWDGRAASLEDQVRHPMANPLEMPLPSKEVIARLRSDAYYSKAFPRVLGRPADAKALAEVIAAYERSLFSVNAPFDLFQAGDKGALNPAARRGLALFGGKARCGQCHAGINFSDELFHVLGVEEGTRGRAAVTGKSADEGAIRTPTLRDLSRTGPYMHDGSLATLPEVIDFYDRGCTPHADLDSKIQKLGLTAPEKADLLVFLESLSGTLVDFSGPVLP